MYVKVPAEVGVDGLVKDVDHVGAAHSNVVFEAILADVLHQALQVVDLRDSDTPVHAVGIVGDFALAKVSLDAATWVVGGDAEEGEGTLAHLGVDSAEGVHLAKCTAEDAEWAKLQVVVADKRAWEVATVGADAFVALFGEIVVPIEECGCLT